jgi:hypothetical protein
MRQMKRAKIAILSENIYNINNIRFNKGYLFFNFRLKFKQIPIIEILLINILVSFLKFIYIMNRRIYSLII